MLCSFSACSPVMTNSYGPQLIKNMSPFYRVSSLIIYLHWKANWGNESKWCVSLLPPIFGSLRSVAQGQRRAPGIDWFFQVSADCPHLAHHFRTTSTCPPASMCKTVHHVQQLLPPLHMCKFINDLQMRALCLDWYFYSNVSIYVITWNRRFLGWKGTWETWS